MVKVIQNFSQLNPGRDKILQPHPDPNLDQDDFRRKLRFGAQGKIVTLNLNILQNCVCENPVIFRFRQPSPRQVSSLAKLLTPALNSVLLFRYVDHPDKAGISSSKIYHCKSRGLNFYLFPCPGAGGSADDTHDSAAAPTLHHLSQTLHEKQKEFAPMWRS